jgi:hypothetical protein
MRQIPKRDLVLIDLPRKLQRNNEVPSKSVQVVLR